MSIRTKRIYEEPDAKDGYRVLVDRLWPRGVSKEKAALDEWLRDIAPSTELRKWFAHDPERWGEFRRRYLEELAEHREVLSDLARRARQEPVTLLYAARDERHNSAEIVEQYLAMLGDD